jgi:hypothetical protein
LSDQVETTQTENDELRIANAVIVEKYNELALRMGLLPTELQDQLNDAVLEGATERSKELTQHYQKKTKVQLSALGNHLASQCFTNTTDVAKHAEDAITASQTAGDHGCTPMSLYPSEAEVENASNLAKTNQKNQLDDSDSDGNIDTDRDDADVDNRQGRGTHAEVAKKRGLSPSSSKLNKKKVQLSEPPRYVPHAEACVGLFRHNREKASKPDPAPCDVSVGHDKQMHDAHQG